MALRKRLIQITGFALGAVCAVAMVVFSLPHFGWSALSVQSGSMVPTYKIGSLVLVHRVPAQDLMIGDVITYAKAGTKQTITHRITGKLVQAGAPPTFITKGDANQANDPTVSGQNVIGKVQYGIPYLGKAADFMRSPAGLIALIYLPALAIIFYETKLMIRRLIELDEKKNPYLPRLTGPAAVTHMIFPNQKLVTRRGVDGLRRAVMAYPPTPPSPPRTKDKSPRPIMAITILVLGFVVATALGSGATFAALTSQPAALTGNTITTTLRPTPTVTPTPTPSDRARNIIFSQVAFRCNADNIPTASRRPKITLYNPTQRDINIGNWTLRDNAKVLVTLPAGTVLKARHEYVITPYLRIAQGGGLEYAGDHLTITNRNGRIIDGLSWGNDTSVLNPSIGTVQAGTRLDRTPKRRDGDTAEDWEQSQRTCQTQAQREDDSGADAGPAQEDTFTARMQPGVARGWEEDWTANADKRKL